MALAMPRFWIASMSVAVWFLCGVIALHRGRMRGSSQGEKGSGGEGVPHHNRRFQLWRTLAGERGRRGVWRSAKFGGIYRTPRLTKRFRSVSGQ